MTAAAAAGKFIYELKPCRTTIKSKAIIISCMGSSEREMRRSRRRRRRREMDSVSHEPHTWMKLRSSASIKKREKLHFTANEFQYISSDMR